MASNSKQYGLILPQKANQGLVRERPSIFNDSESEEETGVTDWARKALKRESEKSFQKQKILDIKKVLEEDPTVYQYDEVYDKIEEKKAELLNARKQQDKKPRYIQSLLQQAEKRKLEQERRNERIIQKEREAEGDKFKDKESFVTTAYRQKLEEFKKQEEEERYQDTIEALTDVSKQKDLSGFYRHLYRQTVSGEQETVTVKTEKDEATEKGSKDEVEKPGSETETPNIASEVPLSGNNVGSSEDQTDKKTVSRHYRKRKNSSDSGDSGEDSPKPKSKSAAENVDADSDFSVDSDSSDSGSDDDSVKSSERKNRKSSERKGKDEKLPNDVKVKEENTISVKAQAGKRNSEDDVNDTTNKKMKDDQSDKNKETASDAKLDKKPKKELVPKPNIWVKRTVGEALENALQRYYQRKAAKIASKG